jgi:hypothetical protein
MLLGVQESVREWTFTFPSEFPLWELESWWTPKISENNCKGQNPLDRDVPYIIEKLLELRCLKWVRVCSWFVRAPKCSNYTLTNLLFGLCKFVWVIELLVNLLSPHPGASSHPSTPEVLQARERAPTPSLSVVSTCGYAIKSIKELGGVSKK